MVSHLKIQKTKKDAVEKFEAVLLKESDYMNFLKQIKKEDDMLYELS
jgi:hypothetical protein